MQFYEADYPIIIKKTDNDYQTNPGEYETVPFVVQEIKAMDYSQCRLAIIAVILCITIYFFFRFAAFYC